MTAPPQDTGPTTATRPKHAHVWVPRWAVHVILAFCTLLIGGLTLTTGDATSAYPVLYFLVATSAFCFLTKVEATAQAGLVTVVYALGLAHAPPAHGSGGLRVGVFVLALVVEGVFIGALRVKQERLMGQLRDISEADPVTGLLDQRGFDKAMMNEFERARRSGSRFSLVVTAVDGFSEIPEPKRQEVLIAVAAAIKESKREIDAAARLVDDELVVLANYTDTRGADELAGRICAIVRETLSGVATLSIGVASQPRHGTSPEILMSSARDARAEAISLGGDRSLVAASAAGEDAGGLRDVDVQVVPVD
jgi:diguanylate cyclase (GGDEF)-like protein